MENRRIEVGDYVRHRNNDTHVFKVHRIYPAIYGLRLAGDATHWHNSDYWISLGPTLTELERVLYEVIE